MVYLIQCHDCIKNYHESVGVVYLLLHRSRALESALHKIYPYTHRGRDKNKKSLQAQRLFSHSRPSPALSQTEQHRQSRFLRKSSRVLFSKCTRKSNSRPPATISTKETGFTMNTCSPHPPSATNCFPRVLYSHMRSRRLPPHISNKFFKTVVFV